MKPLEFVSTDSTRRAGPRSVPVVPIWPGYIYQGKFSLLDGPPGSGKTTVLCDTAARVSTGREMPLSDFCSPPRMTIMVVTEDDIDDTIVPRLKAAGANLDLVRFTDAQLDFESAAFMDMLLEHRYAGRPPLLLLETLTHHLPRGTVFIDEASVRNALYPLVTVLRRTKAGCVGVKHWNKKQGATLVNRGGGSIGFNAIARSVFSCVPSSDDTIQLISVKDGAGERPLPLVFKLVGNNEDVVYAQWRKREETHHPELSPVLAHAVEHMEEVFRMDGPIILATAATKALRDGGLSQHSIDHAKTFLQVKALKKKLAKNGPWYWVFSPGRNPRILLDKWLREQWAQMPEE